MKQLLRRRCLSRCRFLAGHMDRKAQAVLKEVDRCLPLYRLPSSTRNPLPFHARLSLRLIAASRISPQGRIGGHFTSPSQPVAQVEPRKAGARHPPRKSGTSSAFRGNSTGLHPPTFGRLLGVRSSFAPQHRSEPWHVAVARLCSASAMPFPRMSPCGCSARVSLHSLKPSS